MTTAIAGNHASSWLASPSKRDINTSMRHAVRPFITEYKNRSSKSQASRKWDIPDSEITDPKTPSVDVSAYAPPERRREESYLSAREAADAVFSAKPVPTVVETPSSAPPAGRVLPCLIQEERAEVAPAKAPTRAAPNVRAASKVQKKQPVEAATLAERRAPEISAVAIALSPIQLSAEPSRDVGARRERSDIQRRWVRKTELKSGEKWKRRLHEAAR